MLIDLLQTDIAGAVPVKQQMSYSLFELACKGGWLMIVLLILSILAIYLIGKKWWEIHHAGKIDKDFMRDIIDYLHDGKIKSAMTLCSKFDVPEARMVESGLENFGKPANDIKAIMENTADIEVARLESSLPIIATIAGGSPMIGFLGTVIGMVQAFFDMSNAGNNIDITLLSGGIYTAMITTVGGLIVGIIAYFGYNYLSSRISSLTYQLEKSISEFLNAALETPAAENKAE